MSLTITCPAILVVAPASGQGKTTVSAALARLHTREGRRVRAFKCGPDFLDPFWLTLGTGAPVDNVDLWMTGWDDIRARLHKASQEADLIIIEGVMGLFDGNPSAADLAQRLGIPVLAVINASAMASTFGALAYGLQHYRKRLPWAGLLANQVASEHHAKILAESIREMKGVWLGALMRSPDAVLPERHLGLTVATELPDAMARLDTIADALAKTHLGRMNKQALSQWSLNLPVPEVAAPVPTLLSGKIIAVAHDAAFCFIYPANLEVLRKLGASIVPFSPLRNEPIPPCDALWLPGGYPELHAENLSNNQKTAESVRLHIQHAKPVWAECGGMIMLFDNLQTLDGKTYVLWGILPGRITMNKRLSRLGPQQLTLTQGTLRGHTFHYSTCDTTLQPVLHTVSQRNSATAEGEAVYQSGAVRGSYFHPWFASDPVAAAALFCTSS